MSALIRAFGLETEADLERAAKKSRDRVILKRCRAKPRDVIAFLPDVPANPGQIMSYQHIGQHSEADIGFYRDCTRPANPRDDDARALLRELRGLGYNPRLVRRRQP